MSRVIGVEIEAHGKILIFIHRQIHHLFGMIPNETEDTALGSTAAKVG